MARILRTKDKWMHLSQGSKESKIRYFSDVETDPEPFDSAKEPEIESEAVHNFTIGQCVKILAANGGEDFLANDRTKDNIDGWFKTFAVSKRLHAWKFKCQPASADEYVFPRAIAIRTVCEEFESIGHQAGLPKLKIKQLRSTCATELAQKCPLSVVQSHLRHASPSTTAGYYIDSGPALRKAADVHDPL